MLLKEQGDLSATEKLIEHNLRLVAYIAKKFENTGIEFEDLISVGAIGLIKAVRTFKLDKNIRLATYASRCIENEILMQIRKSSKIENVINQVIDEPADRQIINELIGRLNAREREIMVLRYGLMGHEELTQREVALKLGISQSYISRLEKRILNDMRLEIEKLS